MSNNDRKIILPESVDYDDGDVINALTACFGEDRESHVRFAIDKKGRTYLLGIWRDQDGEVTGTDMVR